MIAKIVSFVLFLAPCLDGRIALAEGDLDRTFAKVESLLESSRISYAWGGASVGERDQCQACMECLDQKSVLPREQLNACPACARCSLDCSHFVHLVLNHGGFSFGYLTTRTMLNLSASELARRYQLIDIGRDAAAARRGDLAVYRDHVVLVETVHPKGFAPIVHATGGRDIKAPGLGIQRERRIPLGNFRGPLLRILRHRRIVLGPRQVQRR